MPDDNLTVNASVSSPRNDQQIPSPRRTTESNHMLEDDGGGAKANPASNGGFPDLIVEDLSSTRKMGRLHLDVLLFYANNLLAGSCGNERFNGLLAQARQYIFQGGSRSAVPGASIVAVRVSFTFSTRLVPLLTSTGPTSAIQELATLPTRLSYGKHGMRYRHTTSPSFSSTSVLNMAPILCSTFQRRSSDNSYMISITALTRLCG